MSTYKLCAAEASYAEKEHCQHTAVKAAFTCNMCAVAVWWYIASCCHTKEVRTCSSRDKAAQMFKSLPSTNTAALNF